MTGLKSDIETGAPLFGCWIELYSAFATEVVVQAGYDFLLVDLEHGPGSVMDAALQLQVAAGSGCHGICRVPKNDDSWIKRVLDVGFDGVMIPAVDSVEDARRAVASCRYPPAGKRGMAAAIVRAARYGRDCWDYVEAANRDVVVICQIESAQAVEAVEEIARVEGVDMLFVGPADLSSDMGYVGEVDHPEVMKAITRVEQAAKAAGKLLGAIPTPGRSTQELREAGYDIIVPGADTILLRDAADAQVASLKSGTSS
ncbi:HpcH/HpaI aldolase family protein [Denitrobaculum tricleocarpae]|uniref:2,4-dihydroxyhept-2-ene-1,7-dioic acid aldolase n=1 Tax=Denitrobaculum tricleocarpae TaxID=2591009 RepID=A0A545TPE3_9PROT|nr:aldolase/citrate lyase family protein [Denitrobaculum tricleocarpae]TQV79089.1 2,4-dihydroxyhept-2-ene-1,7-dioic acid aldolase [Denitrobaculum tricleocarpae]